MIIERRILQALLGALVFLTGCGGPQTFKLTSEDNNAAALQQALATGQGARAEGPET